MDETTINASSIADRTHGILCAITRMFFVRFMDTRRQSKVCGLLMVSSIGAFRSGSNDMSLVPERFLNVTRVIGGKVRPLVGDGHR